MNLRNRPQIGLALALAAFAGGCANKDKARITQLEETNRRLAQRVNTMQGQFDFCDRERGDLSAQLAAARGEIGALGDQLAAIPPAEEAAPGWTPVPGGAMIAIESGVLFSPGKVTLRREARRTLDAVASTLQSQYGEKDILIFGHTDDRPIKKSGWTDNWQLSSERALAVVRYMRNRNISAGRLVACGSGEHRPRVANDSDTNRRQNRRVEIYAVDADLRLGRP